MRQLICIAIAFMCMWLLPDKDQPPFAASLLLMIFMLPDNFIRTATPRKDGK